MPSDPDPAAGLAPSGFFVLRTPLLPLGELLGWSEGLAAPTADDRDLAAALAGDRELLRARLLALVERPELREAILVASPPVHDLLETWRADPGCERGAQCERALVRYLARLCGRSTPFGLFAGVSTGVLGERSDLVLEGRAAYRRTTRLDAGYLVRVVEGLVASPALHETLPYLPAPTIYRAGGRCRYVRSRPGADEERYRLVSVRDSAALGTVLAAAADGAPLPELAAALAATGIEPARARRFVDDLAAQQVLVPGLDLLLTGGDSTYGLADTVPVPTVLPAARTALAELDAAGLGSPPGRYTGLATLLADLPARVEAHRLVQVDLAKPAAGAVLGREVVGELLRGAALLRRLSRPRGEDEGLQRFAERLGERYEGRPVPLLEALDPDLGVPLDDEPAPVPLLAGVRGAAAAGTVPWGPRDEHLLARLLELRAGGGEELVLGPRDLERLASADPTPLPDACSVLGAVAARSPAELAGGRFRVLVLDAGGPSGARLLGRFCHLDPVLQAAVEVHLRAEEALDPAAVFAEIVHLSRARDANVAARPVLREYEIPCLASSGAPRERQLALGDLLVSAESGRVVLRSRRLGRRVEPRLTSAHNFGDRGVAVYRFLCRLQGQGAGAGTDFWGPLRSAPFLPRVRHGRVVLALARWRLEAAELGPRGDRTADFRAVQAWRRARHVPRLVCQTDFGGQLPVDLDNVLAVEALVDAVRARGAADLSEPFPAPGELCVHGPEGRFVHELVVPFVRPAARAASRPAAVPPRRAPADRFPPGSEWLYARLYTGDTLADGILTGTVAPLARDVLAAGAADGWFFLRYGDPALHLRLRFHGDPARLAAEVRPAVEAAAARLVGEGLVWRVEEATYQREAARYGGPEAIELAEAVFQADSEAVLAILALLEPGEAGQEERWRLALAGADRLLADLGLDVAARLALVRRQRDGIARQRRWDGKARGVVAARYRRERPELERLLAAMPGDGHPLGPGLDLLEARSQRLRPLGEALGRLEREGRLTIPLGEVAGSLLHMHLNRLLRGDNTAQEGVVCDLLARLYEARSRGG